MMPSALERLSAALHAACRRAAEVGLDLRYVSGPEGFDADVYLLDPIEGRPAGFLWFGRERLADRAFGSLRVDALVRTAKARAVLDAILADDPSLQAVTQHLG